MKSYTVRNEFSALKEFTLSIPDTFNEIGLTIQDKRNIVKKVTTEQGTFVIKNFKGMYFLNRLAYSLFRKSKAARSYIYSHILNDNGIRTPPHVAWLDCYKWGLLTESYFISVFYTYNTLQQALEYYTIYDESYKASLLRQVAAFALKLHRLGIYHEDFSVGNLLVIPEPDGYQFAMVDLNRIKFKKVSYRKGLQNFARLKIAPNDLNILIREYALLSGQSPEASINMFIADKKQSSFLRMLRKKVRRYTLTPLERMWAGKAL